MSSTSLPCIPTELQTSIIRYLDPIALISLSQSSTHFRTLISPTRKHFVERLLALECRGKEGGPRINFTKFGTLEPDRHSSEWEANRWACTGCMKLLPHYAFSNKATSALKYRKPVPGGEQEQKVTSWEPPSVSSRNGGRSLWEIREAKTSEVEKKLRKRYGITVSKNWGIERHDLHGNPRPKTEQWARFTEFLNCGMDSFEELSFAKFEELSQEQEDIILELERHAVESRRAGSGRHARRCNECRFQRGEFRGCAGKTVGYGTIRAPIVAGRIKSYGSVVDRYFPDVSEALRTKRPPFNAPLHAIYRENVHDRPWTQYRIRCRGCSQWKEQRAFRVGGVYHHWIPMDVGNGGLRFTNWDGTPITETLIDGLRCNHCFVQEHGRQALGEELVKWLEDVANKQRSEFTGNLKSGFFRLNDQYKLRSAPENLRRRVRTLVGDMKWLLDKDSYDVTRTNVVFMRMRRAEVMAQDDVVKLLSDDEWSTPWTNCYDESEALWYWLKELGEEIREEGKGDALVDWALERDEVATS
ncbi:F-box protein [Aspergillus undulatus]|uniref:F-box protein n=1 Tax=Aspergillus undulatus TaxID=1810928 RepID=UPI003CCD2E85